MDLQIITVSEVRQRKMKIVESKNDTNKTYLQNRKRLTNLENKLMFIKGERGGAKLGIWE